MGSLSKERGQRPLRTLLKQSCHFERAAEIERWREEKTFAICEFVIFIAQKISHLPSAIANPRTGSKCQEVMALYYTKFSSLLRSITSS